jgi:hypothetical protein
MYTSGSDAPRLSSVDPSARLVVMAYVCSSLAERWLERAGSMLGIEPSAAYALRSAADDLSAMVAVMCDDIMMAGVDDLAPDPAGLSTVDDILAAMVADLRAV